ncbi:unnamed protein product [Rhodiola kirilowii]
MEQLVSYGLTVETMETQTTSSNISLHQMLKNYSQPKNQCAEEGKPKEKRKRKCTKLAKSKTEVESQRMSHIAVERNRRRQMNEHLSTLRSIMPPSYIHKGDQASIISDSIKYVKELEQLLQSLQSHKAMWKEKLQEAVDAEQGVSVNPVLAASSSWGDAAEVRVIDSHANVKLECELRPGMLVKAIAGLEEMKLSVLHLNITSSSSAFFLSFNLKIEEDCKVRSADEIAGAVHHVFNNFISYQSA